MSLYGRKFIRAKVPIPMEKTHTMSAMNEKDQNPTILNDGEEKPSAAKIVLWTLLFQLAWHFRSIIPFMQEGSFQDSDDFLRLHQIRNWMGGQGWFDVSLPRMSLPDGGEMHWSRMVDVPIAGLIWVFDLFTETVIAERLAAIVWPTILIIACVFVLLAVCEKLFPATKRLLALLFVVTCITSLVEFAPSRIDHHGVQILFYCLTLLGLVNADKWFGHYLVGASIAFSIVIGLDVILLLVFILAWLGIEWVFAIDEKGRGLMRTGVAMAVASLLLYPLNVAPDNWLAENCDAISIVYLSAILLISLSFFTLASATKFLAFESVIKTRFVRLAAGAALALASLAILYGAYPQCSAGPMSGISPELNAEWLSNIVEAKGLIAYIRELDPSWIGIPLYLLVIIFAGLILMIKGKTPPRFLAIWATLVICFFLGFVQVRAYRIGLFATVPMSVMIAQYFWDWASKRYHSRLPAAYVATGLVGLLMLSPTWQLIGKAMTAPLLPEAVVQVQVATQEDVQQVLIEPALCDRQSDYAFLASVPKGNILNGINYGPAILVFTEHSVTGGNYHRNEMAILDIQRFFGSEQDKALEIIKRRNADYVMLCNIELDPIKGSLGSKLMGPRLIRGNIPAWLEKISPDGSHVLVYRFVKTAT